VAYFLKERKHRGAGGAGRLNITPLIDINANLLFFLMINASIQEDRLEAGKNVELPESNAKTAESGDLISLVIALDHVSVNELEVMKLNADGTLISKDYDDKKRRVKPLYQEFTTRFQDLVDQGAQPGTKDDDLPVILVQADRRLPYRTVSKLMRTAGQAGFTKFRFAATEVIPEKGFRGETGG
jgi:biopolymer transport protein ExbD